MESRTYNAITNVSLVAGVISTFLFDKSPALALLTGGAAVVAATATYFYNRAYSADSTSADDQQSKANEAFLESKEVSQRSLDDTSDKDPRAQVSEAVAKVAIRWSTWNTILKEAMATAGALTVKSESVVVFQIKPEVEKYDKYGYALQGSRFYLGKSFLKRPYWVPWTYEDDIEAESKESPLSSLVLGLKDFEDLPQ